MRELNDLRGWLAVAATLGLSIAIRRRKRVERNITRPRITPLRVIQPDEIVAEIELHRPERLRRRAG